MRVAVFGPTGPTGQLIVAELLARGDTVVAYARRPERLGPPRERLEVVTGDLADVTAIAHAIAGADAVASALGPHGRSPGLPIAAGVGAIVSAMGEAGVGRIVQVSTASAPDPLDRPDFRQRLLVSAVRTLVPTAYAEVVAIAEILRGSGLDWTLVRVPLLRTTHRRPRPLRVGYPGRDDIGFAVSRESLARFVAEEVGARRYVRAAPMVCDDPGG
ncbi:MAG: NAD(P)H-binding protein [Coriobacteriia bacterium]|nr:NAD(P)H-binding protein [Coriobacteriia bacterium]